MNKFKFQNEFLKFEICLRDQEVCILAKDKKSGDKWSFQAKNLESES